MVALGAIRGLSFNVSVQQPRPGTSVPAPLRSLLVGALRQCGA